MALAVHAWPGPLPAWDDGVLVISTVSPEGDGRDAARARIRSAACEALARLLGVDAARVAVDSQPGSAPRLLVDGAPCPVGLSISHAKDLSVAAFHRAGAVGVDLMEVQETSDWARVAHDYLGMATACRLAATAPCDLPQAFAQAWAAREARLKLHGESLGEWTPLPACHLITLCVPFGFAGVLAL
jgi:4'-phosphopantetheinyl transferase